MMKHSDNIKLINIVREMRKMSRWVTNIKNNNDMDSTSKHELSEASNEMIRTYTRIQTVANNNEQVSKK